MQLISVRSVSSAAALNYCSADMTSTSYRGVSLYFQACDNGRGAVLLSVARGKVSEGIDFG